MSALKSWYTRAGLTALLATGASCTLIYDADVFNTIDAAPPPDALVPDAVVPDAVVPDADPTALRITRLDPAEVFEGAGCIPVDDGCRGDSRAVPIVIHGANIEPDAEVVITGPGFPAEGVIPDLVLDPDGTMVAFTLSVPVLPDLGEDDTASLTLTLRQRVGQVDAEAETTLSVRTLDEFVASVDTQNNTLDTSMLRGLYSRIDIDVPVRFTGESRVQLIAVAELVIQAAVSADGQNATGGTRGQAGPGGCDGGAPQATGGCAGGGAGGTGTGGGGGGGHAEQGENGSRAGAGTGGPPTGAAFLTPLAPTSTASARGHGGGGGGLNCTDLGNATGGGGGGGGGTIELTSRGLLRLTSDATLSVKGGNGGVGNCLLGNHGNGGGGSGGAILARAAMSFTDEGTAPRVDVGPGLGGVGTDGNDGAGGDGAPGRVRVDAPDPQDADAVPPAFSGVTHRYRGPMWSPTIPAIVTSIDGLTLALSGQPQQRVHLDVEGQPHSDPIFPAEGRIDVEIMTLMEGHNQVCARVPAGTDTNQPDAFNCIDIAYIPVPSTP